MACCALADRGFKLIVEDSVDARFTLKSQMRRSMSSRKPLRLEERSLVTLLKLIANIVFQVIEQLMLFAVQMAVLPQLLDFIERPGRCRAPFGAVIDEGILGF